MGLFIIHLLLQQPNSARFQPNIHFLYQGGNDNVTTMGSIKAQNLLLMSCFASHFSNPQKHIRSNYPFFYPLFQPSDIQIYKQTSSFLLHFKNNSRFLYFLNKMSKIIILIYQYKFINFVDEPCFGVTLLSLSQQCRAVLFQTCRKYTIGTRDVFRTQSNDYDGVFPKIVNA